MIKVFAAVLVVLSGCTTVDPRAGFDQVGTSVRERVGKRIHWRHGGSEDQAVAQSVAVMLKEEMTADGAVQVALLNNPRLQAVYEELGIAQADLVQAGLLRNPVFEAAILKNQNGAPPNLDFAVAWDFLGLFTMPLRRQAAAKDFEAAKLRVTARVMDLAGEVRRAFYEAQADQQTVELMRQVVQATDAARQAAERLRQAGNITQLALDQEQVLYEQSRLMLADAEEAAQVSRERLNALMGLWGEQTQWRMAPHLPPVPPEPLDLQQVEKRAVARSLDLAMLQLQMQGAAARVGLTNLASVVPDLEVGPRSERDEGHWRYGGSVGLPLPLFDFGQARRARVRGELAQLRDRYLDTAVRVRSAARSAAVALQNGAARERHLREVLLPLRERITAGSQLEYNAMQMGVFELLLAQQQQILTGQRYIGALRDYWLAHARAEEILNGLLVEPRVTASAGPVAGGAQMIDLGAGGH